MNDDRSMSIQIMGLRFFRVQLLFEAGTKSNLFASKNNKAVGKTIRDRRYASLAEIVHARYPNSTSVPLGTFLLKRKKAGDRLYLKFLNRWKRN